jgi:hypothetical protein
MHARSLSETRLPSAPIVGSFHEGIVKIGNVNVLLAEIACGHGQL